MIKGKFLINVSICDAVDFNGESFEKTVESVSTGLSLSEYPKLKLTIEPIIVHQSKVFG